MNAFNLSFRLNGPKVYRQIVLADSRGEAISKLSDYLRGCGVDCRIQIVGASLIQKFRSNRNVICC